MDPPVEIWRLALATGLRRGELVALRWTDIDAVGERLFVRQAVALVGYKMSFGPPKSRASIRAIAIDKATLDALHAWRQCQAEEDQILGTDSELILTFEDGRPVHPQTLGRIWDRVANASGLKPISLHGLRHTHATLLLFVGVPLKIVSERLGHSSIQITVVDTYQHVLDHMQQGTALKVGELLRPRSDD